MDLPLVAGFIALGAAVGFLAGLLGLGGGMTMVPLLTLAFTRLEFPAEHVVHLALATATTTILFTGIASAREHHRHGAIRWGVVAAMAPGMVAGSLAGPFLVGAMSTSLVAAIFGVFVAYAATQILLDRKPAAKSELPGARRLAVVGGGIGLVSSMVGAGGAFMSVPYMASRNVPLRNCVATSAALGLPIAVAGTIGYAVAGWRASNLPPWSLGYVYLPALVAIVIGSVASAPFGARAAHRWPVKRLRRAFAFLLYALAAYMLWKAWSASHG